MREKKQYIKSSGEIVKENINVFSDPFNDEGYRFPSHKRGARLFADVKFPIEMSFSDKGRMVELSKLMIRKSNMLGYRQSGRIEAYTASEIVELVELSEERGRQFIVKMLHLHVLQRVEVNGKPQYYINPAYFMANGQRLTLDLFLLFRDELTPLLPAWVMCEFLRQARDKAVLGSDANAEAERIIGGDHGQ